MEQDKQCPPNSRALLAEQGSTEQCQMYSQTAHASIVIGSENVLTIARAALNSSCDKSPICSVKAKERRLTFNIMENSAYVCDTCYQSYSTNGI